jgi:hypothetical protein
MKMRLRAQNERDIIRQSCVPFRTRSGSVLGHRDNLRKLYWTSCGQRTIYFGVACRNPVYKDIPLQPTLEPKLPSVMEHPTNLPPPPSQMSAYDLETNRLEKGGRRISRSLTVLRVIIRILTRSAPFLNPC